MVYYLQASSTLYFYPAEGEIEGETGTVECNKIVKKNIADIAVSFRFLGFLMSNVRWTNLNLINSLLITIY